MIKINFITSICIGVAIIFYSFGIGHRLDRIEQLAVDIKYQKAAESPAQETNITAGTFSTITPNVQVTAQGALLISELDAWLRGMLGYQPDDPKEGESTVFLRIEDAVTHHRYEIRALVDKEPKHISNKAPATKTVMDISCHGPLRTDGNLTYCTDAMAL